MSDEDAVQQAEVVRVRAADETNGAECAAVWATEFRESSFNLAKGPKLQTYTKLETQNRRERGLYTHE